MGSKTNPGKFDCLSKAEPDEPIFVLLGRDPVASIIVADWAGLRERVGGTEPEVIEEARVCAESMHAWAHRLGKHEKIEAARREVTRSLREREARGAEKALKIRPISPNTIDEYAAEAEKLDHQGLAVHYACALANWNVAIDERDALKALCRRAREALSICYDEGIASLDLARDVANLLQELREA